MKITRQAKYERWLLDKVKTWLQAQPRNPGIHVSDLLYPRKAYWKRIDPKPMTDAEAGYFIAGQGHHFILEAVIEGSKKVGKADAGSHEWEGIYYSPDIRTPHPQEIKTTRSRTGPNTETERGYRAKYEHYLEQLKAYMAIENDPKGSLVVFYLNMEVGDGTKRTTPTFRWYDVTLTPAELGETRDKLLDTKKLIEHAVKRKDPKNLPVCPEWMGFNCPWRDKCGCCSKGRKGDDLKRRLRV